MSDLGNIAKNVRSDFARALASCYASLPCGMNDDGCTTQAVAAIGQDPDAQVHSPDVQACLAKQKECSGTAGSFSDDLCGTLVMITPSKRSELARCFEGSCELIGPCAGPIVGK